MTPTFEKFIPWTCEECHKAGEIPVPSKAAAGEFVSRLLKAHDAIAPQCRAPQIAYVEQERMCVVRFNSNSEGQRKLDQMQECPAYPD